MREYFLTFSLAVLFLLACVLLSGCTTLVQDCERQGESQYYHCKRVWMAK